MQLDKSAAALNNGGTAWARAGQWDKAAYDWLLASTRDPAVDWNNPSTAENGASWQAGARAWYDGSAWDS